MELQLNVLKVTASKHRGFTFWSYFLFIAFPQTKEALLTILSDLNEDDYFGLVLFDDEIEQWRPSLTKATEDYVATAKEFVKTIEDRGSELIPCGHGTEPTHSICYM